MLEENLKYNRSYFIENQVKQCNSCKDILDIDKFGPKKRGFLGVKAVCKECLRLEERERYQNEDYKKTRNRLVNKWRRENREKWSEINLRNNEARRLQKARRAAFKKLLPNEMSIEQFSIIKTKEYYPEEYEIDHFIPLSWGHGGTYVENLCVIPKTWNMRKSNMNPFVFRKTLSDDEQAYFNKIIKRIAKQYGLTIWDLKRYVKWCEQNKRSTDQIKKDGNKKSFDIWSETRHLN